MKKLNVIKKNKQYGRKISQELNKVINDSNMHELLKVSKNDWWPQIEMTNLPIDDDLFVSLLRQELLKNGLFLASTFNLCFAHNQKGILDLTVKKFKKSIISLKDFILSHNKYGNLKKNYLACGQYVSIQIQ